MEKIKKYIDRFRSGREISEKYDMKATEWFALREAASRNALEAIVDAFTFGYAKGYRAALAEMKKGDARA